MRRAIFLSLLTSLLAVTVASATPVATTPAERALLGRVFPEPINSTNFIQHGTVRGGPSEIRQGFDLLEQTYPGYFESTSIDQELKDPNAFGLGPDKKPPWDPADTGDGLPFYVGIATDKSVPDKGKAYMLILNAHPAENCGQEGMPRFLEDLLMWREETPDRMIDAGKGLYDRELKLSVTELLRKTKIYFVSTSPDDWSQGTGANNENYAGFNENRVGFQDGWSFPVSKLLFDNGYSTLTQPEGIFVSRYIGAVRERELGGGSFAVANDQHGPLPTSGALLFHDQGNNPAKLDRAHDYARRLEENMEEVFATYFSGPGLTVSQEIARRGGDVRDLLLRKYTEVTQQPVTEKAAFLTLEWAEYATIWDHLDYTVTGSWGGYANSNAGAGADSISFETACESQTDRYQGRMYQLFVDNVRAASQTGAVLAAQRAGQPEPVVKRHDLKGTVGFVETGKRITDKDGNPTPPPLGHPGSPAYPQIVQTPYDVSNTDYFRDLRKAVASPIEEVPAADIVRASQGKDTLVVADTKDVDAGALERFAREGGNVVLTDGALQLLPGVIGVKATDVKQGFAYVGYADFDKTHPWLSGLYKRVRQTFDPVGLGLPLLMERDQYWPCSFDGKCPDSGTLNSSPIWSVDRAAWEGKGGTTIATVDPPADRKFGGEGTRTTQTSFGTAKLGKGRVVIGGALLPQASEAHEHWFGLDAYTISIAGQQVLLNAMSWDDGRPAGLIAPTARTVGRCASRRSFIIRLPRTVRGRKVTGGRVTVDGKAIKVQKVRGRYVALVDLRSKPRKTAVVKVVSRTRGGRSATQTRSYKTCVRGKRAG